MSLAFEMKQYIGLLWLLTKELKMGIPPSLPKYTTVRPLLEF